MTDDCEPDIFRKKCKELSEMDKDMIFIMKEKAENLYYSFEDNGCHFGNHDKRMMALAKTNLEQAIMWATKAVTK